MGGKRSKEQGSLGVVQKYFPKVSKVNDADSPVTIEVTKADNNSAQVRDHNRCAMAVACKRKMHLDGVIVSVSTAYFIKGDTATRYRLPPSVSREIVSFDRKAGFDEGTYQLVPYAKTSRIGTYHHGGKSNGDKGGGSMPGTKKKFRHFTSGIRAALGAKTDVRLKG